MCDLSSILISAQRESVLISGVGTRPCKDVSYVGCFSSIRRGPGPDTNAGHRGCNWDGDVLQLFLLVAVVASAIDGEEVYLLAEDSPSPDALAYRSGGNTGRVHPRDISV